MLCSDVSKAELTSGLEEICCFFLMQQDFHLALKGN